MALWTCPDCQRRLKLPKLAPREFQFDHRLACRFERDWRKRGILPEDVAFIEMLINRFFDKASLDGKIGARVDGHRTVPAFTAHLIATRLAQAGYSKI